MLARRGSPAVSVRHVGCPSTDTSPDVGTSSPAMRRRRVVLPEPEAPSTARNSPAATLNEMLERISAPPASKRLVTLLSATDTPLFGIDSDIRPRLYRADSARQIATDPCRSLRWAVAD